MGIDITQQTKPDGFTQISGNKYLESLGGKLRKVDEWLNNNTKQYDGTEQFLSTHKLANGDIVLVQKDGIAKLGKKAYDVLQEGKAGNIYTRFSNGGVMLVSDQPMQVVGNHLETIIKATDPLAKLFDANGTPLVTIGSNVGGTGFVSSIATMPVNHVAELTVQKFATDFAASQLIPDEAIKAGLDWLSTGLVNRPTKSVYEDQIKRPPVSAPTGEPKPPVQPEGDDQNPKPPVPPTGDDQTPKPPINHDGGGQTPEPPVVPPKPPVPTNSRPTIPSYPQLPPRSGSSASQTKPPVLTEPDMSDEALTAMSDEYVLENYKYSRLTHDDTNNEETKRYRRALIQHGIRIPTDQEVFSEPIDTTAGVADLTRQRQAAFSNATGSHSDFETKIKSIDQRLDELKKRYQVNDNAPTNGQPTAESKPIEPKVVPIAEQPLIYPDSGKINLDKLDSINNSDIQSVDTQVLRKANSELASTFLSSPEYTEQTPEKKAELDKRFQLWERVQKEISRRAIEQRKSATLA